MANVASRAQHLFHKASVKIDYSLIGVSANQAIEKGLAEADWYQCPVPRAVMRKLLERRDGPAIRDTLLWFALLVTTGFLTVLLRNSWWLVVPYAGYAVLYASVSDSRWHESGHGTAFRTDWMNNALYEMASFMVLRESTPWRWSHVRHHSDTIIIGRDPEIAVPRPANLLKMVRSLFALNAYPSYFRKLLSHALAHKTPEEATYIPDPEWRKVFFKARVHLLLYAMSIGSAVALHSIVPVLLVGAANLFGTWLLVIYGVTQHAGLAENVLDHRLNCRTVYMNRMNRFLYWNMNYHLEHHMFPLVPYHNLPALHSQVKDDCPAPYDGLMAAWAEIIPAVMRQAHDPGYFIKRTLPPVRKTPNASVAERVLNDKDGWVNAGSSESLPNNDVFRLDVGKKTFAVYRDGDGTLYATDGMCTHGNTHLADGLVIGKTIECPKHNGRFHLVDGSPARAPICRGLATYPVREFDGRIALNLHASAQVRPSDAASFPLRVVSSRSVATFIRELTLQTADGGPDVSYEPGDYIQIAIPAYDQIRFDSFDIPEPYRQVWLQNHLFDLKACNNKDSVWNNYSLASNARIEAVLRFNVRIATPPPGQDCPPGAGSSYLFSLQPGDIVSARGPFGDFHIRPTHREMIYIGGGAGMAPLRSHLSRLLETERSQRRISFWYGARSRQEIFYEEYFRTLEREHANFRFHLALSAPLEEDEWEGHEGFVHEVLHEHYLRTHEDPASAEYYLCGPPMMIKACTRMLREAGVPVQRISYDEF